MIIRVLLGVLLIVSIFLLFHRSFPDKKTIKNMLFMTVTLGGIALLAFLALTGRLHWLASLIGSVILFAPRLISLLKLITPMAQKRPKDHFSSHTKKPRQPNMTVTEARAILNLSPEANREEIIQAHRGLIQKNHPDRGGSDYLAHQINLAKEVLLNAHDKN